MNIIPTALPEVLVIEPKVFGDDRGYFFESFNARAFAEATGIDAPFVQDNQSGSVAGVLRGLHYQIQHPQGKLVRVASGTILDVAVDMRRSSPNFGRHVAVELGSADRRQLWIPPGFAHGFVVKSEFAEVLYKTTDYWHPEHERSLLWNDPALGIDWGVAEPTLSGKDRDGKVLAEAESYG